MHYIYPHTQKLFINFCFQQFSAFVFSFTLWIIVLGLNVQCLAGFSGLLRAGGVIFYFPLLPLGLTRRDRKCTEASIFEVSPVEEQSRRHCVFDEKTGLVHVTVTKDSMAFQHPGSRFTASTHPFNFDVQSSPQQKDFFQLEVCKVEVEKIKSCSAPENPTVAFCQDKQSQEQIETQKQIDSISCLEVHPCLEQIGSSGHANLDEVKTSSADEVEELKGFGASEMLEKTERIIVNHTETVWVCNDISVLLFHGVITETQQQVAGFWSEECKYTAKYLCISFRNSSVNEKSHMSLFTSISTVQKVN